MLIDHSFIVIPFKQRMFKHHCPYARGKRRSKQVYTHVSIRSSTSSIQWVFHQKNQQISLRLWRFWWWVKPGEDSPPERSQHGGPNVHLWRSQPAAAGHRCPVGCRSLSGNTAIQWLKLLRAPASAGKLRARVPTCLYYAYMILNACNIHLANS